MKYIFKDKMILPEDSIRKTCIKFKTQRTQYETTYVISLMMSGVLSSRILSSLLNSSDDAIVLQKFIG